MTTQPTNDEAPKKKRAPAKPKQAPATNVKTIGEDTKVGEPKNTNDGLFHIPFIAVLIVLAMGATHLYNSGLTADKTQKQLEKVETQFDGYKDGVRDSN